MTKANRRRSRSADKARTYWWQVLSIIAMRAALREAEIQLRYDDEGRRLDEKFLSESQLALQDALDDLDDAFDRMLLAVDRHVAEMHESATQARTFIAEEHKREVEQHGTVRLNENGEPFFANMMRSCDDKLSRTARLSQPVFKERARDVFRIITAACWTGERGDMALLRHLADEVDKNRRVHWVEICERHREEASHVYDPEGDWLRTHWIGALPPLLATVDSRAAKLTYEQVHEAWTSEKPQRLAARLAAACGAFGYRSESEAWSLMRKYCRSSERTEVDRPSNLESHFRNRASRAAE